MSRAKDLATMIFRCGAGYAEVCPSGSMWSIPRVKAPRRSNARPCPAPVNS